MRAGPSGRPPSPEVVPEAVEADPQDLLRRPSGGSTRLDVDVDADVRPAGAGRLVRWRGLPLRSIALVVLSVCLLSVAVVASAVKANPGVWVIDEWTYIDYLHKVHDGDLYMERGDLVGQEAMRDVSCRGLVGAPWEPPARPACDLPRYEARTFLNEGISSGAIHPPTYFVITDLGARAVMLTGATDDLVTAGRLAGAGWMAAGLLALLLLMRELRVPPVAQAIGTVIVAVSPRFVESWQYLTPDAANVLVGSLVALAAVRWVRRRCPTWLFVLAGAGAMAFKSPNIMVVCAAALIVLFLPGRDTGWGRRLLGVAAVGGAAAAVTGVLTVVAGLTAGPGGGKSNIDAIFAVPAFQPVWLLDNLGAFVGPFGRTTTAVYGASVIVAVAVVGVLIGAALSSASPEDRDRVVLSRAFAVMLVGGPALVVLLVYLTAQQYVPVDSRYGYSLMPGAVAVAASTWRSPGVQLALGGVVAVYAALCVMAWSAPFPT